MRGRKTVGIFLAVIVALGSGRAALAARRHNIVE